ncbi:MAG TPA: DUF2490 domain-containing protein [Pirellulaceae bacterium]|nr:DUF2490 domain-containing protein [Pirellulaceae bacterium]HMO91545.1 DUF2490 domain-containing protein [Pirellulaceae bacterium]HMP68242.1 DUF2490 domain-containing protein [Pirellulaceae bacterium]
MKFFSWWVFLIACVTASNVGSLRGQTTNDAALWLAVFAQDNLGGEESRWKWWFDGHLRYLDDVGGLNQHIVRPGIGKKISDDLVFWGGYAWIHTSPITGDEFDEHRIWQQFTWSHKFDSTTILLRPRLEQRFVETGSDLGWRFRQLVRIQQPIHGHPRLSMIAWDEFFFHLNDTDWGARSGFDQNRVFLGLGVKQKPESRLRTEIGYLNQYIDLPTNADRSNHTLSINFFY